MTLALDVQSELTIFQLLEEDLGNISDTHEAEKLQLTEIMAATAFPKSREMEYAPLVSDEEIALQLYTLENQLALDQVYAELLHSQDASFAISMQEAQRLAAAEQKVRIDGEFARKLQANLDEDGSDNRMSFHDSVDADCALGQEVIDEILASDPNSKGKGKRKETLVDSEFLSDAPTKKRRLLTGPYSTCGICGDVFQHTYSPMTAAQTANSSKRLPFGLRLPCPGKHPYCMNCLSQYISSKLDPDGQGGVKDGRIVFPIRCPECPADKWPEGIPDTIAVKVLTKDTADLWHYQKLLDSLPRYYCPNKSCSALVQMDESSTDPQATCPLCSMIMCVPCKVQWHDGYTCEAYQALPAEDRSAEDLLLLRLAKKEKWRRCNKCKRMVELISGCNHITCICGGQFCFKCGADWDIKKSGCTRGKGCKLWEDDDQLLDQDQRGAAAQHMPLAAPRVLAPVPAVLPQYVHDPPPRYENGEFGWMRTPDRESRNHKFTGGMLKTFSCGYCGRYEGNLWDLQAHLMNVGRHPVFSCCGKFYREQRHYEQHQVSGGRDHHDTYIRGEGA
ncbi:hypothetical protein FIBSPDRAFT_802690 [Athelia psychrophila]|uniref:RBR-type E3 ubiquitin transferase n=1 Tax=Athelia psychrophila TaxID=1759441 RepID=A0A165XNQ2_9AGAM|nr:hypothetical protein FIBSPDRAFT_802690 [Fibularhizoctonia sp. CBS 109695]